MTQKELYQIAKERYAAIGIDTEAVIEKLSKVGISMHCWQGDDVKGFENAGALTGGISSSAAGITSALILGVIFSVFAKSKSKRM